MADNTSVCSTIAGPPHIVWLRSEHETEDEAIRVDLPHDAYVSDILIKAPNVMNLAHYRPVELQVVRDGIPLSNRSTLSSLFSGDLGEPAASLSFVVRPRASSVSPPSRPNPDVAKVVVSSAKDKKRSPSAGSERSNGVPVAIRRGSTGGQLATVSLAVRRVLDEKPPPAARVPSPARNVARAPSPQTARPTSVRVPSPSRVVAKQPVANKAPISARAAPSAAHHTVVKTSTINATAKVVSHAAARQSSPSKVFPSPSTTTPQGGSNQPTTVAAAKSVPKSSTAAHQPAASAGGKSAACCAVFKAQWGNALCATCKHSRQAHQMLHAGQKTALSLLVAPSSQYLDPQDSLGSPIPSRDVSALGLSSGDRLDHVS